MATDLSHLNVLQPQPLCRRNTNLQLNPTVQPTILGWKIVKVHVAKPGLFFMHFRPFLFSHSNSTDSSNFKNINWIKRRWCAGILSQGWFMAGAGDITELWRPPYLHVTTFTLPHVPWLETLFLSNFKSIFDFSRRRQKSNIFRGGKFEKTFWREIIWMKRYEIFCRRNLHFQISRGKRSRGLSLIDSVNLFTNVSYQSIGQWLWLSW